MIKLNYLGLLTFPFTLSRDIERQFQLQFSHDVHSRNGMDRLTGDKTEDGLLVLPNLKNPLVVVVEILRALT